MNTIIVSDVHIGSKYCLCEQFINFIKGIPAGCTVVLNGDTVDYRHRHLSEKDMEALDLLRKESFSRRVVWVRGNHDRRYILKDPGRIEFKSSYSIGKRLYISHGHKFEERRLYSRMFVAFFRFFYDLRIMLGAEPVHVAYYAKKFPHLYRFFRARVRRHAVEQARENGYEAIACGHTHFTEDCAAGTIRYLNTGSWTESPIFYLAVNDKELRVEEVN